MELTHLGSEVSISEWVFNSLCYHSKLNYGENHEEDHVRPDFRESKVTSKVWGLKEERTHVYWSYIMKAYLVKNHNFYLNKIAVIAF